MNCILTNRLSGDIMPKKQTTKRPKTRRMRTKRTKAPKLLRVLLVLTLLAAGGYCLKATVCKLARPYLISHSESQEIVALQKQIASANIENIQLKRESELMGTPQGKEAEARKLGWVKKGEVALVVQQPDQSRLLQEQAEAMKETFWQSAGKKLVGVFARTDSTH